MLQGWGHQGVGRSQQQVHHNLSTGAPGTAGVLALLLQELQGESDTVAGDKEYALE